MNDDDGVSPWLKTLLVLALMVPMTAYVAGSLASSDVALPTDREPVIIEDSTSRTPEPPRQNTDTAVKDVDAEQGDDGKPPAARPSSQTSSRPAPGPTPRSTSTPVTSPTRTSAPELIDDDDDNEPRDDHSARVVTPMPTPIDDDEEQAGDRDEDTDGDDDAGGSGSDDDEPGDSSGSSGSG